MHLDLSQYIGKYMPLPNGRMTLEELVDYLTSEGYKVTKMKMVDLNIIVIANVGKMKICTTGIMVSWLGTFKIIPVEKRESIHVNTGERFVIPEHYKFSFLPDKELRELE